MDKTIKVVLQSKYALILSVIPLVNLILLLLAIGLLPWKKSWRVFSVFVFEAMLFFWLRTLFPGIWQWLFAAVLALPLGYLSFRSIRTALSTDNSQIQWSSQKILLLAVVLIVLFVMIFMTSGIPSLKEQTNQILESIVHNDEEAYRSLSYDGNTSLKRRLNELEAKGIQLADPVEFQTQTKISNSIENGKSVLRGQFYYLIGGHQYVITVEYTKTRTREGISSLTIESRNTGDS